MGMGGGLLFVLGATQNTLNGQNLSLETNINLNNI